MCIARTNDLGEFRVTDLEPGTYYLRASTTETWADDDEKKGTRAYALTYFPGALGTDQAQAINVTSGQEVGNLEIVLLPGRAARINGVVQNSAGEPIPHRAVHVDRITRGVGGVLVSAGPGGSARTDAAGVFEIRDVAPGEYLLYAPGGQSESATLPLIVTDADVQGIVGRDAAIFARSTPCVPRPRR